MILRFDHISYTYSGIQQHALNDISIAFQPAKKIALIGSNGSGKSTLMLIANGILKPQNGTLYLNEQAVQYDRKSLMALRQQAGVIFQNPDDQLFSASVYQDISLGPLNPGLSNEETEKRVREIAKLCKLTPLLDRPTHALSGGEKTCVALAGILEMQPTYLFADEITNNLDPWMRKEVLNILDEWVALEHMVVLSSHDWQLAAKWSEEIIWLDQGSLFICGSTSQVIKEPAFLSGEFIYG